MPRIVRLRMLPANLLSGRAEHSIGRGGDCFEEARPTLPGTRPDSFGRWPLAARPADPPRRARKSRRSRVRARLRTRGTAIARPVGARQCLDLGPFPTHGTWFADKEAGGAEVERLEPLSARRRRGDGPRRRPGGVRDTADAHHLLHLRGGVARLPHQAGEPADAVSHGRGGRPAAPGAVALHRGPRGLGPCQRFRGRAPAELGRRLHRGRPDGAPRTPARRAALGRALVRSRGHAASIRERGPFGTAEAIGSEPLARDALSRAPIDPATRVTTRLRPAVRLRSLERELPSCRETS
jgi:hypothetical protein